MHEFTDASDAGRQLAIALGPLAEDVVVLAASPDGLPVAQAIDPQAKLIRDNVEDFVGRNVLVVDLGVETGTRAWEVVQELRSIKVANIDLAVPICSRQVLAKLENAFDHVTVLVTPLAPRALRWHYADLSSAK